MAYPSDIVSPSPASQVITVLSKECMGGALATVLAGTAPSVAYAAGISTIAGTAWGSANRAYYVPFVVTEYVTVKKMFWLSTGSAPTYDLAIYREDGTRVVAAGGTTTAGTSATIERDITDTILAPGRYYMAMAQNSGANTTVCVTVPTVDLAFLGVYIQETAYPLPSTATFATAKGIFILPFFGLTLEVLV